MPLPHRLRPYCLGLLFLAAALMVGICGLAAGAGAGGGYDYIHVHFSGDAYVTHHDHAIENTSAGAFWEEADVPFDTLHHPGNVLLGGLYDEAGGAAVDTHVDGVFACNNAYKLTQEITGGRTASGVRFWTHEQPDSGVATPPEGAVLVTAVPFFGDFGKTSGSCTNTASLGMSDLGAEWKVLAHCVPAAGSSCGQTLGFHRTTSCGVQCATTYRAVIDMRAERIRGVSLTYPVLPISLSPAALLSPFFDVPSTIPLHAPKLPPPPPPIIIKKPPADGEVDGTVFIAKQPVLTTRRRVTKGVAASLPLVWMPGGIAQLRKIKTATMLTARVRFTPTTGQPQTQTLPFYVLPTAAGTPKTGGSPAAISSVSFTGSVADPTVVVHGTNLGAKPAPSPAQHPAGLDGCPKLANDTGYDYGTNLYIAVPAKNFSGGRYRPSVNEIDCLDLVVTKFTADEVDFHFGPFYSSAYPKFALAPGLQVQAAVNGVTYTTTVKYR